MRTATIKTRPGLVRMVTQSPAGGNKVTWLPYAIAWAAGQGIARDTHHTVILYGEFGTARFSYDGSGNVEWNERSTEPGTTTRFDNRTRVCI